MLATLMGILIPLHLAIIMDGNRRGGEKLFGNRMKGHELGATVVELIIRFCLKWGIKFLTLYAFSTENWSRSPDEIRSLFDVFRRFFGNKKEEMHRAGVRLRFIGRRDRLPYDIKLMMSAIEKQTAKNDKLVVTVALDYGGRDEIVRAFKKLFWKVLTLRVNPFKITEKVFAECLDTQGLTDPDLLLRTGGEERISNYLLWQCAYTEFLFIKELWCECTDQTFEQVLIENTKRHRRFGGDEKLQIKSV